MAATDAGRQIILDTNTFVAAAFNPRSNSGRILRAVEEWKLALVWNEATRGEARNTMMKIPNLSWGPLSALFKEDNEYRGQLDVGDYQHVEDPDDRKFAALAEATNSIVITNDRHLLSNRERLKAPVVTPREFVDRYMGSL
jgi:predicted nucleic acid-binding protein